MGTVSAHAGGPLHVACLPCKPCRFDRMPRAWTRLFFTLAALPYDSLTTTDVWAASCAAMAGRLERPERPAPRVLDLGCGPGLSALELLRARPAWTVVGLDIATPMLRRASAHAAAAGLGPRLPLVAADATHAPFREGSFDAALGHSFLYLVPRRREALLETRRALAPGGRLALLEPAAGSTASLLWKSRAHPRWLATLFAWRVVSGSAGRFTPAALAALLADAGFTDVAVEPTLHGAALLATATRP